jgi:DNA-binding CsgD family transcriptional regulator
MKPLEPHRDYLTTVSQMKSPDGSKDMGGIHMGASAAFLNGTGPLGKNGEFNVIVSKKSIDQYIADAIADDTPLRSLEVGTEDMGTSAGACDGYPCVFFNTMSWLDDTSPLPIGVNPQVTFERMFGDPGTPEQRVAQHEVLLDAIQGAIERSRQALRHESAMRGLRECYATLTPREREVMALVVSGLLNKQVAGELDISEITVKAHRGQVMRKMKADSLAELVTKAASLGLRPAATN